MDTARIQRHFYVRRTHELEKCCPHRSLKNNHIIFDNLIFNLWLKKVLNLVLLEYGMWQFAFLHKVHVFYLELLIMNLD